MCVIAEYENIKNLMKAIDAHFDSSDKMLANTLPGMLLSMKFTGTKGVCKD